MEADCTIISNMQKRIIKESGDLCCRHDACSAAADGCCLGDIIHLLDLAFVSPSERGYTAHA
eukprot:scaffold33566_cov174-Skeletonema_dohrnii-CCMP3373.AAC.2